jgi:hypothetical protein
MIWYVVPAILVILFIGGAAHEYREIRRRRRIIILYHVLKTDGREAAKAMKARLDGEWW